MFRPVVMKLFRNNLKYITFPHRETVKESIAKLSKAAKNPYEFSLPLMANSTLGDEKNYNDSRFQMETSMTELNREPTRFDKWMHSNAFKAWMWGRILSSAMNMSDADTIKTANTHLTMLLNIEKTPEDNFAFSTWAMGYQAAGGKRAYESSRSKMLANTEILAKQFTDCLTNHTAQSDALWAMVMNLTAAASVQNKEDFDKIKNQIMALGKTSSVTETLKQGLIRTAQSNDYPAWALAKIQLAAAILPDVSLYHEISPVVEASIEGARLKENNAAEYVLAVLDNTLALENAKEFVQELSAKPTLAKLC